MLDFIKLFGFGIFIFVNTSSVYADSAHYTLFNLNSGAQEDVSEITSASIVSSALCYEGNRSSHPVELARQIRDYDYDFDDLQILDSWAYVQQQGEIEIRWSSVIDENYSVFTGVSHIRNCEDLSL